MVTSRTFTDPLVDCRNCKERFRADHLPESGACPNCGAKDSFTEARNFNLMFKTFVGPVEDDASVAYLRPETAQGIFVNFKNVQTTSARSRRSGSRRSASRSATRSRPATSSSVPASSSRWRWSSSSRRTMRRRWYEYWVQERYRWFIDLGIPESMLRIRPHDPEELSHYSAGTSDLEFAYPWGWGELEGIANRADFDLTQHAKFSGEDSRTSTRRPTPLPAARDRTGGRRRRAMLAFLLAAYHEEEVKGEKRIVLRLDHRLAPIRSRCCRCRRRRSSAPLAAISPARSGRNS